MYINRYESDSLVDGRILGVNGAIQRIRNGIANGSIDVRNLVLSEPDRLDNLAGRIYGDGRLWWIIAAASGIGWWLQVPAGTRIVVPIDVNQVKGFV